MPPSPEILPEFVAVVEDGSISKASRTLRVPRASLSRRLSALEEELGVRLLHRGSRPLRVTAAGASLYQRAKKLVADTEEAWASVRVHDRPRGRLRVSLPPNAPLFLDYVSRFAKAYPDVQMIVSTDARHVDLGAEGIDAALRIGRVVTEDAIARKLWSSKLVLVASSDYLRRHGHPRKIEDLDAHRCLVGYRDPLPADFSWPLRDGSRLPIRPAMLSSDIAVLLEGARTGSGIALMPEDLVTDDLAAGTLEVVLSEAVFGEAVGSLIYTDRRFLSPQLRAFIDALSSWSAASTPPSAPTPIL